MTAISQMPISKIVLESRTNAHSYASKIVDIINYRLPMRGVVITYESVVDDLFKLRFDLMNEITIEDFFDMLVPEIQTSSDELNKLVADIMPIYLHITQQMLIHHSSKNQKTEPITLQNFKSAIAFLPDEQGNQLRSFVEDSLQVDFALIAVDCFSNRLRELPPSVSDELCLFLRLSFERYAARAAFFKIWDTDQFKQETQILRSIQIVQSKMDCDAGLFAFKAQNIAEVKTYFENII